MEIIKVDLQTSFPVVAVNNVLWFLTVLLAQATKLFDFCGHFRISVA